MNESLKFNMLQIEAIAQGPLSVKKCLRAPTKNQLPRVIGQPLVSSFEIRLYILPTLAPHRNV